MDHDKLKIMIDAILDGEATAEEVRLGRLHLAECPACAQEQRLNMLLSRALKMNVPPLDADFSLEIMERIQPQKDFSWGQFVRWLIPIPVLASAFMVFNTVRTNDVPSTYHLLSEGMSHDSGMDALFLENNPSSELLVVADEGDSL